MVDFKEYTLGKDLEMIPHRLIVWGSKFKCLFRPDYSGLNLINNRNYHIIVGHRVKGVKLKLTLFAKIRDPRIGQGNLAKKAYP